MNLGNLLDIKNILLAACAGLYFCYANLLWAQAPPDPNEASARFSLTLGDREIVFFREGIGKAPKMPLILSLHRNETTGYSHVRHLGVEYPNVFVGIATPGDRRLFFRDQAGDKVSIDPNRMFSDEGVSADLKRFGFSSVDAMFSIRQFAKAYLNELDLLNQTAVIAIHNNRNRGYSVISYKKGGSESQAAKRVYVNPKRDSDDFILVTNPAHFDALLTSGFNLVLQDNLKAPNDGSLSVFCGRNEIDYINIEAEHGHGDTHRKMLRAVLETVYVRPEN